MFDNTKCPGFLGEQHRHQKRGVGVARKLRNPQRNRKRLWSNRALHMKARSDRRVGGVSATGGQFRPSESAAAAGVGHYTTALSATAANDGQSRSNPSRTI